MRPDDTRRRFTTPAHRGSERYDCVGVPGDAHGSRGSVTNRITSLFGEAESPLSVSVQRGLRWTRRRPCLPADRFVELIWELDGTFHGPRWILPKPVVDIAFSVDSARNRHGEPEGPFRAHDSGWIVAVRATPIFEETGTVHRVGVRFRPGAARAFLRLPLNELSESVTPLERVLGADACRIAGQLEYAIDTHARFRILEHLISSRIGDAREPASDVLTALSSLCSRGGQGPVGHLAADAGVSIRHLIARFKSEVGASPKTLARILRLHHAIDRLRSRPGVSLAQIAFDLGFADQSHFTRDFRAMTGRTPGDFRRGTS